MRTNSQLFFYFLLSSVLLLLTGCGGSNSKPYDGNWSADYSALSQKPVITETQSIICNTPPAAFTINKSEGSATQVSTCVTSAISKDVLTGVITTTVIGSQSYVAYISINISTNPTLGGPDVIKAIVNGVTHTGQCINTSACSAVSSTGETLGLTRV